MEEKELFKPKGREMEVNMDDLAREVKAYRIRHGMTQKELGAQWGLSRYVIIRVERAKLIRWESAYRIFAYLSKGLREEVAQ